MSAEPRALWLAPRMPSRPRSAAVTVTAALCLGLSACGSSGSKSVVAPPPSPTAQPASATPATSESASPGSDSAKKLTAAGVLLAADVPGFTGEAQPPLSSAENAIEDALYKCLGLSSPKFLDRNPGTEFSKDNPDTDIDTNADVVDSATAAHDLARAATGQSGPGCYQTYFQSRYTAEGDKIAGLTVTPVAVSVPGSDSVFALHVVGATTGDDDSGPFDTYVITAAHGRTEVTINYTLNGSAKASSDDAARLAEVVVKRVGAVAA